MSSQKNNKAASTPPPTVEITDRSAIPAMPMKSAKRPVTWGALTGVLQREFIA